MPIASVADFPQSRLCSLAVSGWTNLIICSRSAVPLSPHKVGTGETGTKRKKEKQKEERSQHLIYPQPKEDMGSLDKEFNSSSAIIVPAHEWRP